MNLNLCCSYTHEFKAIYWSVVDLLGATPLEKSDSLPPLEAINYPKP